MPPSRSKATESTPITCFFSMKHFISLTNVVFTISIFAYHRGYYAHSCFVLIHNIITSLEGMGFGRCFSLVLRVFFIIFFRSQKPTIVLINGKAVKSIDDMFNVLILI